MVLVNTDEICAAIKDIFEDTRAIAEPAGALGVAGLKRWVERERRARPRPGGDQQRRQHELRPPALHQPSAPRPARTRGAAGGRDPGGAGQLPALLRRARRPRDHRVQLPLSPTRRAPTSSSASRSAPATPSAAPSSPTLHGAGLSGHRPDRQRDRQAARPLHGRRPRRASPTRCSTASSSPSGPARCCASSTRWASAGTSACSTTATTAPPTAASSPACRSPPERAPRPPPVPRRPRLPLPRGNRQPRLRVLPGG